MSDLGLALLIPAAMLGLFQLALLASLVVRGGRVTYWWGTACVALLIGWVFVR